MKYSIVIYIFLFLLSHDVLFAQKKSAIIDLYPNIVNVSVGQLDTLNGQTYFFRVLILISEYQSLAIDKVVYMDDEGIKRKVTKQLFLDWNLFPNISRINLETVEIQIVEWIKSNQLKIKLNDYNYLLTIPPSLKKVTIKELDE